MKRDNEFTGDRLDELAGENRRLREALAASNAWICNTPAQTSAMGKEKFKVVLANEAALSGEPVSPAQPAPQYDYRLFVSDWLGKHDQYFGYLADMLKDFHELIAPVPPSAVSPQDREEQ